MSHFSQADQDYLVLMVREFSEHDRFVVALVLEALSETDTEWTASELSEIAALVRGEG